MTKRPIQTGEAIVVVPREETPSTPDPAERVKELERTADALRDNLGTLVDELGRRGRRAIVPAALAATTLAALGITAGILWRRRRTQRQPRRLQNLALALRRATERPEQVAAPRQGGLSKVAFAAAAAAASIVARHLAQRWVQSLEARQPRTQLG
jgi:hypothetical protein